MDQVRRNLEAAVGEAAPAGGDFHRRQGRGAQGQRQVARQVLLVEAEARDVVDRVFDTQALQDADRYQVAGLVQGFAQADGTEEGIGVVLRTPDLVDRFVDKHDRRIVDQGRRRIAAVQRRAIDERLEAGARLALGLHRPVVVALLKGEAAYQGANCAVVRIQRYQRALYGRHLREGQGAVFLTQYADQIADLCDIRWLTWRAANAVGIQERPSPFHAVPAHVFVLALAGQDGNAGLVDLGNDRRIQRVEGALFAQFGQPGVTGLAGQA